MNLVIVESPAKAKTINKYLGENYVVLASYGHVRDLPSKNGSVDTENNFNMTWEIDPGSKKPLKEIYDAAKDAKKIILATDPDREGEAIAWHVKNILDDKKLLKDKKVERVVFNEITKKAVKNGIDNPREFLGFEVGERVASPAQIASAVRSWSQQSDRIKVIEYAQSHEGRPLFAVFISSPENIKNLDEIKESITALADASNTSNSEARSIINKLPAIAWMAYSIHGNETSGADGALASIYHLIASSDQEVLEMLDDMVVIIDPMMNPDGRARFAKNLEQYRGTAPNYDDQALLHTGDWPYGRTNHYYYDLNRDWFYLTQPETQGRVPLINEWSPQIMVDGHEMGAQDTFMTGPPREPINTHIDRDLIKWGNVFAQDQGNAFDERNWRFYTGEWHEDLYPGYSFYSQFRGTLGIEAIASSWF